MDGLIERIPGATYRKWRAVYQNGLTKTFTTKKKAREWLTLLAAHPIAADHLERLRGACVLTIQTRQFGYNWWRVEPDNGLCAILEQFAQARDYTFTRSEPRGNNVKRVPSIAWISYLYGTIWINPTTQGIGRTHVLAHEIGHDFELTHGIIRNKNAREQTIDAIAAAILYDNGIDTIDGTLRYIAEYRTKRHDFFRGDLDEQFVKLYAAYSDALTDFLRG